jgi:hypothetical protein
MKGKKIISEREQIIGFVQFKHLPSLKDLAGVHFISLSDNKRTGVDMRMEI